MNPNHQAPRNRVRGLTFEKQLEWACRRQQVKFVKFPLGAKPIRQGRGRPILIPIKTYLDYVLIYNGRCVFIDCKSFDQENISYSMLTAHQVNELYDIQTYGVRTGYLVFHRKSDKVCFYDADKLRKLGPRESVHLTSATDLGSGESFSLLSLFHSCSDSSTEKQA